MKNFKCDINKMMNLIETKINRGITSKLIFEIVNESFGINNNVIIDMSKYCEELCRLSIQFNNNNNFLYLFFDIAISIIMIKLNDKWRKKGRKIEDGVDNELKKKIIDSLYLLSKEL